jgi:hypothetical protein
MNIVLTPKEAENLFYDALCNALNYMESGYDLELTYSDTDYNTAKSNFKAQNGPDIAACYEDILMQILKDGNRLKIVDHGYESYTRSITIEDVHKNVALTPVNHLLDAINENGDAITGDCILQSVFFGEVIFG